LTIVMAPVERNALVIDQPGKASRCTACDGLVPWLRNRGFFREIFVIENGVEPAPTALDPDTLFIRLSALAKDPYNFDRWRAQWPQARSIVIICRNVGIEVEKLLAAVSGADEFVFCSNLDAELELRAGRLFKSKNASTACVSQINSTSRFRGLPFVGASPNFVAALDRASIFARTADTVLISGETGSGKELFARAIHYQGDRQSKPFIPVNCGAMPDHLFENELFGHVKGAFTDASSTEKGLIAEAEGGTLFLDEVDALSPAAQIKLLRFLQNGEYRPLGSARPAFADVRVIAATNADLMEKVRLKQFREDFLYRLTSLSLSIPPLRERKEDIRPLAAHFLAQYARENQQGTRAISTTALEKLTAHTWPGNVRELESVLRRALVLSTSPILLAEDIDLPSDLACGVPENLSLRQAKIATMRAFERNYLVKLLSVHRGNITRAAQAAGKERRAFQRLVRKHSLDRQRFQP
jgi:DNA-binding NtrC family response regulator